MTLLVDLDLALRASFVDLDATGKNFNPFLASRVTVSEPCPFLAVANGNSLAICETLRCVVIFWNGRPHETLSERLGAPYVEARLIVK